jgi:hypothetical protein
MEGSLSPIIYKAQTHDGPKTIELKRSDKNKWTVEGEENAETSTSTVLPHLMSERNQAKNNNLKSQKNPYGQLTLAGMGGALKSISPAFALGLASFGPNTQKLMALAAAGYGVYKEAKQGSNERREKYREWAENQNDVNLQRMKPPVFADVNAAGAYGAQADTETGKQIVKQLQISNNLQREYLDFLYDQREAGTKPEGSAFKEKIKNKEDQTDKIQEQSQSFFGKIKDFIFGIGSATAALSLFPKSIKKIISAITSIVGGLAGGKVVKSIAKVATKAAKSVSSVAKVATSAITKGIAKTGAGKIISKSAKSAFEKIAPKVIGKNVGKSALKKIPIAGAIAGGLFAIQRAFEGDWTGAGMEIASGAASTIPGLGTAASVGIDLALAARDVSQEGDGISVSSESATNVMPAPQPAPMPRSNVMNRRSSIRTSGGVAGMIPPAPIPAPKTKGKLEPEMQAMLTGVAEKHGIDPAAFIAMAGHESGFNPSAVSPTGAMGLFQFTKGTGRQYAEKLGFGGDLNEIRMDPVKNAEMAAALYKDNLKSMQGVMKESGFTDEATAAYLAHNLGAGGAKSLLRQYGANPNAPLQLTRDMALNPANFRGVATPAQALQRLSNVAGSSSAEAYRQKYQIGQMSVSPSVQNMSVEPSVPSMSRALASNSAQNAGLQTSMNARTTQSSPVIMNNMSSGGGNGGASTPPRGNIKPRPEEPYFYELQKKALLSSVS